MLVYVWYSWNLSLYSPFIPSPSPSFLISFSSSPFPHLLFLLSPPPPQDLAYEEQLSVCGEELPPLEYNQVGHTQLQLSHNPSAGRLLIIFSGQGAGVPGPVSEGDSEAPPTHHDTDEDGQNTTGWSNITI